MILKNNIVSLFCNVRWRGLKSDNRSKHHVKVVSRYHRNGISGTPRLNKMLWIIKERRTLVGAINQIMCLSITLCSLHIVIWFKNGCLAHNMFQDVNHPRKNLACMKISFSRHCKINMEIQRTKPFRGTAIFADAQLLSFNLHFNAWMK